MGVRIRTIMARTFYSILSMKEYFTLGLELTEQNSGKASILIEATHVVKDMLDRIKSLKKENATLLSESQYVIVERNELEYETCGLHKQISELKNIIKERIVHVQTNVNLNAPAIESQEPQYNPVFVIPVCHIQADAGVVIYNNAQKFQ
ncbi:hypothetical protein L2E82_16239 [Cichorium intybus]|uniref:Uncharacterized protein n=1 Tax=Cichorium intybus TaxID=13427 RepID=A0ACB9F4Z5_CICIN|nr:hypothetical protein L2E82_16239 [Cichorium intybus]